MEPPFFMQDSMETRRSHQGRNILVWCVYNGLWICIWFHWWNGFGSSLPFACLMSCVWYFSFAMIIKLLMWAEARGSRGQQGNGDSAA